ncbi:hypothetical protein BH23ACT2_BH23ACT2_01320 [soil metagenome]
MIRRSPEDIFDFVLDMDRYRHADPKISKVYWEEWEGDEGRMKFGGKLRHLPAPAIVVNVMRHRYTSIDIRADESTLLGRMVRFRGTFDVEDLGNGSCMVRHVERFNFRAPLKWIADPLFGAWLAADTKAEMTRLREMIEPSEHRDAAQP